VNPVARRPSKPGSGTGKVEGRFFWKLAAKFCLKSPLPCLAPAIDVLRQPNVRNDVGGGAEPGHWDLCWLHGMMAPQPVSIPRITLPGVRSAERHFGQCHDTHTGCFEPFSRGAGDNDAGRLIAVHA